MLFRDLESLLLISGCRGVKQIDHLNFVFKFSLSCESVATFWVWCMLRCDGVSEDYGLRKE